MIIAVNIDHCNFKPIDTYKTLHYCISYTLVN